MHDLTIAWDIILQQQTKGTTNFFGFLLLRLFRFPALRPECREGLLAWAWGGSCDGASGLRCAAADGAEQPVPRHYYTYVMYYSQPYLLPG